jgi:hypothetical protein
MNNSPMTLRQMLDFTKQFATCEHCKYWDRTCQKLLESVVYVDPIDDSLIGQFETDKDFGCIHWEQK